MAEDQNLARVDIAIEKLTIVSSNLDKLLGIHEQRLNQADKQMSNMEANIEKRREVYEGNFSDVYDTIRKEDKNVLEEIAKFHKDSTDSMKIINDKVNKIEQSIWLYMGGLSVIVFILTYGQSFIKLLQVAK